MPHISAYVHEHLVKHLGYASQKTDNNEKNSMLV